MGCRVLGSVLVFGRRLPLDLSGMEGARVCFQAFLFRQVLGRPLSGYWNASWGCGDPYSVVAWLRAVCHALLLFMNLYLFIFDNYSKHVGSLDIILSRQGWLDTNVKLGLISTEIPAIRPILDIKA